MVSIIGGREPMSNSKQEPSIGAGEPTNGKRRPLFGPNRSGVGFHPYRWEGWLIIAVIVAVIVTVIVLLRTGVL
jgi:hypothetical protein